MVVGECEVSGAAPGVDIGVPTNTCRSWVPVAASLCRTSSHCTQASSSSSQSRNPSQSGSTGPLTPAGYTSIAPRSPGRVGRDDKSTNTQFDKFGDSLGLHEHPGSLEDESVVRQLRECAWRPR